MHAFWIICTYVHTHTHACIHAYIRAYNAHTCVHTYIYRTRTHIHMHTHTHPTHETRRSKNNIGNAFKGLGKYDEALKWYTEALTTGIHSLYYHFCQFVLLRREALTWYTEAVNTGIYVYLGVYTCLYYLGVYTCAHFYWHLPSIFSNIHNIYVYTHTHRHTHTHTHTWAVTKHYGPEHPEVGHVHWNMGLCYQGKGEGDAQVFFVFLSLCWFSVVLPEQGWGRRTGTQVNLLGRLLSKKKLRCII